MVEGLSILKDKYPNDGETNISIIADLTKQTTVCALTSEVSHKVLHAIVVTRMFLSVKEGLRN